MFTPLSQRQAHEIILILAPAILLIVGAFWLAFQFVEPAPPKKIAIAAGGKTGAYYAFAKRYAEQLAKSDIKLEVLETGGAVDNITRLRTPKPRADLALLQGGTANDHVLPGVVSLGRVFIEPAWIFYRSDEPFSRIADLKGMRIATGGEGSGTQILARELLQANKIDPDGPNILPLGFKKAAEALISGEADAIFLTMAPEAELVSQLLTTPEIRLMSLKHADAYARRYPYLTVITLPAGVIDLVNNIPSENVTLVAAKAALAAREDVHPAIVDLMVQAAIATHKDGGMFQKINEFPQAYDPEFPMSQDAERIYKSGSPFFRRYLPFWLATFVERMLVMIVPIATILIPMFKIVPMAYEWRIKSRINYWYAHLKKLEKALREDTNQDQQGELVQEIHRIEDAVASIPVPLHFSDRLYELRAAVDLVRQRILARGSA